MLKIVLDNKGRYLQKSNRFESLDLNVFLDEISFEGKEITNYFDLVNGDNSITRSDIVLYTSSQVEFYKISMQDILFFSKSNKMIPSFDVFMAHENKFAQELYNKKYNLETNIETYLLSDVEDYKKLWADGKIWSKFVVKGYNGSSSTNVRICSTFEEGLEVIESMYSNIIEAHISETDLKYDQYRSEASTKTKIVIQKFIKSSKFEWRIAIMGNKYFGFKRFKKNENSLASGNSDIYGFDLDCEIPIEILIYSKELYNKIDSPFVILDIAINDDGGTFHLMEWSGIQIGNRLSIQKSHRYYENIEGNNFEKKEIRIELETAYAEAVNFFIKEKGWN